MKCLKWEHIIRKISNNVGGIKKMESKRKELSGFWAIEKNVVIFSDLRVISIIWNSSRNAKLQGLS